MKPGNNLKYSLDFSLPIRTDLKMKVPLPLENDIYKSMISTNTLFFGQIKGFIIRSIKENPQ